jgi:hypothetical protein
MDLRWDEVQTLLPYMRKRKEPLIWCNQFSQLVYSWMICGGSHVFPVLPHVVGATTDLPPADLQVNVGVLGQDVELDTRQITK